MSYQRNTIKNVSIKFNLDMSEETPRSSLSWEELADMAMLFFFCSRSNSIDDYDKHGGPEVV